MKNFLFIVFCLFLTSCDENTETKEERSERLANIRQKNERCKSAEYVYYSIDDINLKLKRKGYVAGFRGGRLVDDNCESSPESPVNVTSIIFGLSFALEDHSDLILGYKINMSVRDSQNIENYYAQAKADLLSKNKTFDDLPIVDGFHKYTHNENLQLYRYFAVDEKMRDISGTPITLRLCPREKWANMCSTSFQWKPKIRVSMSAQNKSDLGLDVWEDIYPAALEALDSKTY